MNNIKGANINTQLHRRRAEQCAAFAFFKFIFTLLAGISIKLAGVFHCLKLFHTAEIRNIHLLEKLIGGNVHIFICAGSYFICNNGLAVSLLPEYLINLELIEPGLSSVNSRP